MFHNESQKPTKGTTIMLRLKADDYQQTCDSFYFILVDHSTLTIFALYINYTKYDEFTRNMTVNGISQLDKKTWIGTFKPINLNITRQSHELSIVIDHEFYKLVFDGKPVVGSESKIDWHRQLDFSKMLLSSYDCVDLDMSYVHYDSGMGKSVILCVCVCE